MEKVRGKVAKVFYMSLFCIVLASVHGQTEPNKKVITNKECTELAGIGSVENEDLLVQDKEFTNYLLKTYSEDFSHTTVELKIVFHKSEKPCCRIATIYDHTIMNDKQVDYLLEKVLAYPWSKKIIFKPNEKTKYLTILISGNKEGKTNAVLFPVLLDKSILH